MIITRPETMPQSIQIFPNPAKGYFSIRSKDLLEANMKLTIFTSEGIVLKEYMITPGIYRHECLVDIRDLEPGLYFVMVKLEASNIIQKLVVM